MAEVAGYVTARLCRRPLQRTPRPIWDAQWAAASVHRPRPYAGRILFLQASDEPALQIASLLGWDKLADRGLDIRPVPGNHSTFLEGANAAATAEVLRAALREAAG
jgi:thioesterase domain-containing protein